MNRSIQTFLVLASAAAVLSGCSVMTSSESQCKGWQTRGEIIASLDSCMRCYDEFGNNPNEVQGCAMGLDASKIFSGGN